ncbi:hypothetical protein CFP56_001966 [Quercus suber]|uniref:Uncharacterized protein n=1 Tax=Quercus suber TaxID=58331 RepID=A0AAW0LFD4_QUESU
MVPMIEAKDCYKAWDCKGDDRCRADCQNHFKGQGEIRICIHELNNRSYIKILSTGLLNMACVGFYPSNVTS